MSYEQEDTYIHTRSPLRESKKDMPASTTQKKIQNSQCLSHIYCRNSVYGEHFSALLSTGKAVPRATASTSASFEDRWGGQGKEPADVRYPRDLLHTYINTYIRAISKRPVIYICSCTYICNTKYVYTYVHVLIYNSKYNIRTNIRIYIHPRDL